MPKMRWLVVLLAILALSAEALAADLHTPDRAVEALFDTLGPTAVFLLLVVAGVGIHLPEDFIVIPAGWEAASGEFSLWWTVAAAFTGVVLGDAGWFFLWRRFGGRLVRSRSLLKRLHPRRVLEIKHLFDHYGARVLVVARCLPGARTPAVAVAGLLHVRSRVFLAVELPMAAVSVAAQLAIGWFAQRGVAAAGRSIHWVTLGIGIAMFIAAVGIGIFFWHRYRLSGRHLPRAKVAWLRSLRQ